MEQIYAITHNGLPRSQGGRLICYQVGGLQIFPGITVATVLAPRVTSQADPKRRRQEQGDKVPSTSLPSYDDLPKCRGFTDLCSGFGCAGYTRLQRQELMGGRRTVRVCAKCGRVHRYI